MKRRIVDPDSSFKVRFWPCGHIDLMTHQVFNTWGGSQDQFDRIDAGLKHDEPSLGSSACPQCMPNVDTLPRDSRGMIPNPLFQPPEFDD